MPGTKHRRKPFSGKAKAAQLKAKRERKQKRECGDDSELNAIIVTTGLWTEGDPLTRLQKFVNSDLRTVFRKDTPEEISRGKKNATLPMKLPKLNEHLRCSRSLADVSKKRHPTMPIRPDWQGLSGADLEDLESSKFETWRESVYASVDHIEDLNHFEHNLEVWRQLWRVLERSNLLVLLMDSRCPYLHFHATLYYYIRRNIGKPVILCLTKADLVTGDQARATERWFSKEFPDTPIIHFASSTRRRAGGKRLPPMPPHAQRSAEHLIEAVSSQFVRIRGRKEVVKAEQYVTEALQLIRDRFNTTMLHRKEEEEEDESEFVLGKDEDEDEEEEELLDQSCDANGSYEIPSECKVGGCGEGDVTVDHIVVGLIGDPNMGKSTLLNDILGTNKVSTSATPGHTKHMQTHYVTRQLVLCDCPGVVFPQVGIPRPLQVIFGTYPIAQVREPYAVVRYLAERCWPALPDALKLHDIARKYKDDLQCMVDLDHHQDDVLDSEISSWSPYSLCSAFAIKLGFFTKGKGGRPDTFRAANRLLRDALNGRSTLKIQFYPPDDAEPTIDYVGIAAATIDDKRATTTFNVSHSTSTTVVNEDELSSDEGAAFSCAQPNAFSMLGDCDSDSDGSSQHCSC